MSSRVKLGEETRLKATAEEAAAWEKRVTEGGGKLSSYPSFYTLLILPNSVVVPQNFISDIFFLCAGFNHLGIVRTIGTHDEILKHLHEIDKWLETAEATEVPPGVSDLGLFQSLRLL